MSAIHTSQNTALEQTVFPPLGIDARDELLVNAINAQRQVASKATPSARESLVVRRRRRQNRRIAH